MPPPHEIVLTLPGFTDPFLAIAACRAGALGVLDLEHERAIVTAEQTLAALEQHTRGEFGIKLDADATSFASEVLERLPPRARWAILTGDDHDAVAHLALALADRRVRVLVEVRSSGDADLGRRVGAAGLIAKGAEAGGRVGDETTFILLQRLLAPSENMPSLPVWAQGGIGTHTAAACAAAGAAGVVLDWQLSLTREAQRLPAILRTRIEAMDGSETACLGGSLGAETRLYARPGVRAADRLRRTEAELDRAGERGDAKRLFHDAVLETLRASDPEERAWLVGQDAAFAAPFAARYRTVGGTLQAIRRAIGDHLDTARRLRPLDADAPLARSHRTRYPILQGPMTRVSDVAPFAESVAAGGALPFLALALMRAPEVERLLRETRRRLGERPWGVGILGFVPLELRREQLAVIRAVRPPFALIAGGRPDQAHDLEKDGIATYLHVPSPGLLQMFLADGARRFVFEGRECGGHVGPRSSFVLWQSMVDILLDTLPPGEFDGLHVIFAGGIHDALSASMISALAAPLAAAGAKVGVLLGTAYLFTEEAVATGAIEQGFQEEAIRCERTVLLESGPGHATRCVDTAFAREFQGERRRLTREGRSAEEIRDALERLNLGRLRIAAKGIARTEGGNGASETVRYRRVEEGEQRQRGMYMIGQVAEVRDGKTTVEALHRDISVGATERLGTSAVPRLEITEPQSQPSDIAIVGIGCLLPKANNHNAFWENILNKKDAITEVPPDRWDWRLYFDADPKTPDKVYSRWGGFLDEIPFDPLRYGMPPNTLASIEPVQLLTLEVTRAALGDADYLERSFDRERTSVIIGAGGGVADLGAQYCLRSHLPMYIPDAPEAVYERLPRWTEDSFAGILPNVIAGRVANRFDFGGVNFTVDAACASSLAALYQGVRELETGQSNMVIVGGVDTLQNPFAYLCFAKTQALSPSGRCRTFDASADGIVISEGLVAVVLKRLTDAERDGDRIYAVIKAVGGSSDGRDRGLTAPRPEGQVRALERAYAKAGFSPASVELFEAHGTGTVAGDDAEAQSLSRVLVARGAERAGSAVGSVKSMIGHTKCAAGLAGLVKVALALHNQVLPATLHVERPDPKSGLGEGPLYVNTETRPWMGREEHPRRAGVSAFGFGGTNFHAVLEEYAGHYLDEPSATARAWPGELFLWSGADRASILAQIDSLGASLDQGAKPPLADLAWALHRRRAAQSAGGNSGEPRPARKPHSNGSLTLALVAVSLSDLREKISRAAEHLREGPEGRLDDPRGIYFSDAPLAREGRVAFLFPGQGSQAPGMLRDLAVAFPEVREAFERADRVLRGKFDRPLSSLIFPPPAFTPEGKKRACEALTDTRVAQPALGAAGVALLSLLSRLGVRPDMVAGHSYGEYVALHAAGRFDEATLLELSEARGRAIIDAAGEDLGTMAALDAPAEKVEALLDDGTITIANRNAPRQTIISGSRSAIEGALARLKEAGVTGRSIPVACAFHSPLVAPARDRLAETLNRIPIAAGTRPVYSNTLAAPYPADSREARDLLADHLVRPVRFQEEIEAMVADGARIFVETGPGAVLTGLVRQILAERDFLAVCVDTGRRHGILQLLHALAQMAAQGVPLRPDRLFERRELARLEPDNLLDVSKPARQPEWRVTGGRVRSISAPPPQAPAPAPPAQQKALPPPEPVPAAPRAPAAPPAAPSSAPISTGAAGGDRSAVMRRHQELMNQFLETQRRVMLAYLQARPGETARSLPESEAASIAERPEPIAAPPPAAPAIDAPPPAPEETPDPGPAREAPPEGRTLTLEGLTRLLVRIVSERTGYPAEMLELDLDLEGDLGIDSIKRVEVLGTFQKTPEGAGLDANEEFMERLRGMKTLRAIARFLFEALPGGPSPSPEAPAPGTEPGSPASSPAAGRGGDGRDTPSPPAASPADASRTEPPAMPAREAEGTAQAEDTETNEPGEAPSGADVPRFVIREVDAPLPEPVPDSRAPAPRTAPGGVVLITDDGTGVAEALLARLARAGARALIFPGRALADPKQAADLLAKARREHGSPVGLLHLAPLAPAPPLEEMDLPTWRDHLARDVKGLFHLLRETAGDLKKAADAGGAWVLAATAGAQAHPHRGGVAGLLRCVAQEWPAVYCRAVDLDARLAPDRLAERIWADLTLGEGDVVSAWRGDRRVILRPEASAPPRQAEPLDSSDVLLVTGGARGITAEIARVIAARVKPTLVLAGRSALPSPEEPADIAGAASPQALRAALLARARAAGERPTPRQIEARLARIQADREMRANLRAMEEAGARVIYHAVDVRDAGAMQTLIDETYERFGRIDGVLHGAGVIEDKLLEEKPTESFDRVLDTKADSAFLLGRALRPEGLRFLIFFGSVAGCFGNRGQSDYGAANAVLNALAARLDAQWPARVTAVNWGPWDKVGMVAPEVKAQFASRGVQLIPVPAGCDALVAEAGAGPGAAPVVVIGDGPWKAHAVAPDPLSPGTHEAPPTPLLEGARFTPEAAGMLACVRTLDPAFDRYLHHHQLDGKPVVPAAVALALMAEAAQRCWPQWRVIGARNLRVLRGITLDAPSLSVRIAVRAQTHAPTEIGEEIAASVEITEVDRSSRPYYRASILLGERLPEAPTAAPEFPEPLRPYPVDAETAYRQWLFHGPVFQCIERIEGFSEAAIAVMARASSPVACLPTTGATSWPVDPVLLDGGLQLALLWVRAVHDLTGLPSRIEEMRIHAFDPGTPLRGWLHVREGQGGAVFRGDIRFVTPEGKLALAVDGFEFTCSNALNRLVGWSEALLPPSERGQG